MRELSLGETASKAGTLLNFAAGGEGRGYTDAQGNFIARRRPRTDLLPRLRSTPLFPGDSLVDELPTLTDVYDLAGAASPARSRKLPNPGRLLRTGRLDALDSVARNAPGVIGEENFFNLGLGDHPLQALNRQARNEPNFLDDGRREITGREDDAFKFRVVTLRQLRDARLFFHNGAFNTVRDVVQYFNAGVPQNAQSGGSLTLTPRFTNPRGPGSPRGLGLSEEQVNDLTDFLENALYDPAFVRFDPKSTTDTFSPNERDLNYSMFRPDLAALGAVDGRVPSGLPLSNNDALSRRDLGLEFLDVSGQVDATLLRINRIGGRRQEDFIRINSLQRSEMHSLRKCFHNELRSYSSRSRRRSILLSR